MGCSRKGLAPGFACTGFTTTSIARRVLLSFFHSTMSLFPSRAISIDHSVWCAHRVTSLGGTRATRFGDTPQSRLELGPRGDELCLEPGFSPVSSTSLIFFFLHPLAAVGGTELQIPSTVMRLQHTWGSWKGKKHLRHQKKNNNYFLEDIYCGFAIVKIART